VQRYRGADAVAAAEVQRCRGAEWVLMLRFNRRGDCAGGMQRWEWEWYRGATKVVQRCRCRCKTLCTKLYRTLHRN